MTTETGHNTGYEYAVVAINWFIWGFVALDRLLIAYLFPWVVPDLKMNFTQAGLVMSVLGICWSLSAVIFGGISDKVGRRIIIIPATIIFSLGSWFSGMAHGLATLLPIRAVMGVAEGAYNPTAVATVAEVSLPTRRATNIGIFMSAFAVVGMLLGPLYATHVATTWGWRVALYLTIIPGIVLALVFWRFVHEPPSTAARKQAKATGQAQAGAAPAVSWFQTFKHRNVWLGAVVCIFIMGWSWMLLTFGMLFFTKARGIPPTTAGSLMAIHGLGSVIGYVGLTWFADQVGRKTALICAGILTCICTIGLIYWAPTPGPMMVYMFFLGVFGLGMFPIIQVVAFEAVPFSLAASSVGVIIFVGEVMGAAVVPALGGILADARGLNAALVAGAICALLVAIVASGLLETAPKVLARRSGELKAESPTAH